MSNLRFFAAMAAGKLSTAVLRAAGRNATHTPGKLAVSICPDFIGHIRKPDLLVCVTGTNGKTTVSNLMTSALKSAGYDVINNSYGSNIQAGLACVLLQNSGFSGKPKKTAAVLEVDERSSLKFYPYMKPDLIIVNNIMRDSLKRNAHTDFISYIINSGVPEGVPVVLNADDIICSQLLPQSGDRTYFGVDAEIPAESPETARDIVYCPKCGGRLRADWIRYNHIGRFHCEDCGFGSPERDFTVTGIDRENNTFTVRHDGGELTFRLPNDNITNVYNFCAVTAALTKLGMTADTIAEAFGGANIVKTRFQELKAGRANVTMILAKGQNPVACSRVYNYVASLPGDNKCVLVCVDDVGDNIRNSESTCWLYDADYTPFADPAVKKLIFAGKRRFDHVLRCRMSGVDTSKIETAEKVEGFSDLLEPDKFDDIYILYDNYLLDVANAEAEKLVRKGGAAK